MNLFWKFEYFPNFTDWYWRHRANRKDIVICIGVLNTKEINCHNDNHSNVTIILFHVQCIIVLCLLGTLVMLILASIWFSFSDNWYINDNNEGIINNYVHMTTYFHDRYFTNWECQLLLQRWYHPTWKVVLWHLQFTTNNYWLKIKLKVFNIKI